LGIGAKIARATLAVLPRPEWNCSRCLALAQIIHAVCSRSIFKRVNHSQGPGARATGPCGFEAGKGGQETNIRCANRAHENRALFPILSSPPPGALLLFDGTNPGRCWVKRKRPGEPADWPIDHEGAMTTRFHNGQVIHNNVEISGPTGGALGQGRARARPDSASRPRRGRALSQPVDRAASVAWLRPVLMSRVRHVPPSR
jgi:hypothetical protein